MRFTTFTVIILHLSFRVATTEKWLAVSPHDIQTQIDYKEIKRRYPKSLNYTKETTEIRNDVCTAVLNSPLFFHGYSVHVKEDETTVPIYNNYGSMNTLEGTGGTTKELHYEMQEVQVGGRLFHELMFSCKAWNGTSRNFVEYFITREYFNHNGAIRFIFKHLESEKSIISVAIAEEPAKLLKLEEIRPESETIFREKSAELHKSSLPICDLTPNQRFRLCTQIFSTEKYHNKVTFFPSFNQRESPQPKCEKLDSVRIILKTCSPYPINDFDETYSLIVWAIRCELELIRIPTACIFYISFGLEKDTFFLYLPKR